jgi:hypothetical protein
MCPSFKSDICELADMKPRNIPCADSAFCMEGDWERCKIVIAQFFISTGMAFNRCALLERQGL